ncbi:MAG TPA: metallophosphoesterase [Chthoniobacterales bacterium]|nr:metallophosphoesterase [Chthoniobacterales bacterium]
MSAAARATDPTPTPAPSVPPRDWSQNPAIVQTDWPILTVWAIGDTHGDYGRLIDLLVKGGIIHEVSRQPDQLANVKWKAGNAILVCTGDMIDKGRQSIEVLQFFMHLQKVAPAGGGQVIVTLGNHEAEFLANPTDKNKEFIAELGQRNIDVSAVQNGTDSLGLGQFMRSLPFAARVHGWFFAHAGNTNSNNMPDAGRHPRSLVDLRLYLETDVTNNGYGGGSLSDGDSLLEARLDNPWWEKKPESRQNSENRLRNYVLALAPQVEHLVVGHKPGRVKFNGDATREQGVMVSRCAGLLFLIDCGMTSAAKVNYSTGALLRIQPNDAYSIRFEGNVRKEERLWTKPSGP